MIPRMQPVTDFVKPPPASAELKRLAIPIRDQTAKSSALASPTGLIQQRQ